MSDEVTMPYQYFILSCFLMGIGAAVESPVPSHQDDLKSFHVWLDRLTPLPTDAQVKRLESWLDKNPHDEEAIVILDQVYQLPRYKHETDHRRDLDLQLRNPVTPAGMRVLGFAWALGFAGDGHRDEGFGLLNKAIDAGDGPAYTDVGMLYGRGIVFPRDDGKAEAAILEAVSRGDKRAWRILAVIISSSPDGTEDSVVRYLQRAAEAGDPEAKVDLAKRYMLRPGNTAGIDAVELLRSAADGGLAEGQYLYSDCLAHGRHTPRDSAGATQWCQKAAEQGFPAAELALAESYLGSSLGYDIQRNYAEGMQWLIKSADDGDPDANYLLGCAYLSGSGVKKDMDKATKYLRRAHERGKVEADAILRMGEKTTDEQAVGGK